MASAFAGQIEIFAFPDPPAAWAACNGQLLPIQDYQMLYKLIGTTYGGAGAAASTRASKRSPVLIARSHTKPPFESTTLPGSVGATASHSPSADEKRSL